MSTKLARVGLSRQGDRRKNVYRALDLVREDVTPKVRQQVMLKPNFLTSKNQLASSHADAMRGAIDFLLSTPKPPDGRSRQQHEVAAAIFPRRFLHPYELSA